MKRWQLGLDSFGKRANRCVIGHIKTHDKDIGGIVRLGDGSIGKEGGLAGFAFYGVTNSEDDGCSSQDKNLTGGLKAHTRGCSGDDDGLSFCGSSWWKRWHWKLEKSHALFLEPRKRIPKETAAVLESTRWLYMITKS